MKTNKTQIFKKHTVWKKPTKINKPTSLTHSPYPAMNKRRTTNKLTIHLNPVFTDTQKSKYFVKAKEN